jgi:integrase
MEKLSAQKPLSVPIKKALKDSSLKALKPDPDGARQTVWDALMPGMAVRVSAKGKRSFYAVKRRAGDAQPTWHLLGVYPIMGLSEAREAARQALTALMMGQHPKTLAEEKRRASEVAAREAATNTFGAVADAFVRRYLPEMKPSSARSYGAYLRRELIPALGGRPIAEIRRREIIALIEDVTARSGKASALATLAVLRKCLNWALSRDIPDYEANPAAAINANDVVGKTKARDRLLTDAELVTVWRAISAVSEPFATVYKLLLLTGARRDEIAAARWDDFDEDKATLTVPAARSKVGDAMLIPLPSAAVELIKALPRFSGPYIFSTTAGRSPITAFSHAKTTLDRAVAASGATMPAFVVHDFRRCVRSGLGRLGVASVVAELCLGHKQPGIVGVYDRHSYYDEKRAALRRWEAHLLSLVEQPPEPAGDNVVPMRGRA